MTALDSTGSTSSGLIPLNLKGAFTSPAIPPDYNLDATSPTDLTRFGLPPMPTGLPPDRAAEWKRTFAPDRLAAGRIVPELVVQKGRTHLLRGVRKAPGVSENILSNWAGGIVRASSSPTLASAHALDGYRHSIASSTSILSARITMSTRCISTNNGSIRI